MTTPSIDAVSVLREALLKLRNASFDCGAHDEDSEGPPYVELMKLAQENTEAVVSLFVAATERAAIQPAGDAVRDAVLEMALDVVRLAYDAMDNTEDDGNGKHWDAASFDALSDAMDKLEALPDDRPGYVMGPAAKVAWALRTPAAPVASAPAQPVAYEVFFNGRWKPASEDAYACMSEKNRRIAAPAQLDGDAERVTTCIFCDHLAAPAQGELSALPDLPKHPEKYHVWTEQERKAIEAYGLLCRQQGGSDAADAARYRWMRFTYIDDESTWPDDVAEAKTGEQLDATIDAAIQAQAGDAGQGGGNG